MVIRSPFRDYYDFVARQYGGGDPKITYVRQRLCLPCGVTVERFPLDEPSRMYFAHDGEEYMYLIVVGRAYLLARARGELPETNPNLYHVVADPNAPASGRRWWARDVFPFGVEHPKLIDLCRRIGAPVFAITRLEWGERVFIAEQVPILERVGMASLFSPQQMYQEIAMFVGNRMKEPPDTQPPVQLSNKEKIIKAGFDLVTSFRHRK